MATGTASIPTVEEYSTMVRDVLCHGATCLALAIAKETGIVDVLLEADKPLTSVDIATKAKLKERYVREVLNCLTAARFIQLETETPEQYPESAVNRYLVPEQHRGPLKQGSIAAPIVAAAARQYSDVKECFAEDAPSCVRYEAVMFDNLDVQGKEVVSIWLDIALDTSGLRDKLEKGIHVAEVGCGSGWMTRKLAELFPASRFHCTDAVSRPVEIAHERAKAAGLTNVQFEVVDVCQAPESWAGQFDWILAQNVIHDLPYPQKALEGIFKSLKPGGIYTMIDECVSSFVTRNVGSREAMMLYALSTFLCIPESFQQPDSAALGACWGEERACAMAEAVGFRVLKVEKFKSSRTKAVWTCQKPK